VGYQKIKMKIKMAFDEKSYDEVAFGSDEMVFNQVVDSIKIAFDEVVGRRKNRNRRRFFVLGSDKLINHPKSEVTKNLVSNTDLVRMIRNKKCKLLEARVHRGSITQSCCDCCIWMNLSETKIKNKNPKILVNLAHIQTQIKYRKPPDIVP
jgi:nicotinic acid mononucleotide adenylyltransferase